MNLGRRLLPRLLMASLALGLCLCGAYALAAGPDRIAADAEPEGGPRTAAEDLEDAGSFIPERDLVVIDPADQEALIRADLQVTWKGMSFILAEWNTSEQEKARDFGIPYRVILSWVGPEQDIYIFQVHEEEDEFPVEWSSVTLYKKGREVVLLMNGWTAESWTGEGYHAVLVPRVPRGWAPAAERLIPFSCSHNATIADLLSRTSQSQWLDWDQKLSGEETVVVGGTTYTIDTRYSNSMGSGAANAKAYDFAVQQAQVWHYPAGNIEQDPFTGGGVTAKNLIVTIPGQTTPSEIVVMSAHLDSISGSATNTTNAPGANDNGTGSSTIMEAMRLFRQFRFQRTLKLILFTGEEQGLIGSGRYVLDHSLAGYVGVVNLDMFGYDLNDDSCFEIHVGTRADSLDVGTCFDASLSAYGLGLSRDFLTTGATGSSDHASFWNANVGAIEIAENYFNNGQAGGCVGSEPNPGIHTVNDNIPAGNVMPSFAHRIAKAGFATGAAMAIPIQACFTSAPFLTATPVTGGVDLSWASIAGASTYRVFRSTQGCEGQWFEIGSTAGTTFTDATGVTGTVYQYYVEAVAADGFCVSAPSACISSGPLFYHASAQGVAIQDTCASGGPGNGNGFLDPGETAVLPVTLLNDATGALTSVSGVLTITTPGVTVTDGAAAWPDIQPSASAVSSPNHFAVSVAPSVACGTSLANTLSISHANGADTASLGLVVGTTAETLLLNETFSGGIPASWTVVNGGTGTGPAATWTTANPGLRTITAPFSTPFAIVDSDAASNFDIQDEQLITPSIDASSCSAAFVEFSNQFRWKADAQPEKCDVDVSTDGGGLWTTLSRMQLASNGYPTPNTRTVDITSAIAANPSNVKVRFHYFSAQNEWWWAIDNVKVRCQFPACNTCAPVATAPGEAGATAQLLVQRSGGNLEFSWGAPGCSPVSYALYRGDPATLRTSGYSHAAALTCAEGTTSFSLPETDPRLGPIDYFLVVADTATEEGSYGRRSSGAERPVSAASCRGAQNLAPCGP